MPSGLLLALPKPKWPNSLAERFSDAMKRLCGLKAGPAFWPLASHYSGKNNYAFTFKLSEGIKILRRSWWTISLTAFKKILVYF